jgi:hypothetical protein
LGCRPIQFVFNCDPAEAESSQVLDKLREDLESKKYLVDEFFRGRSVDMSFEFRSAQTRCVGEFQNCVAVRGSLLGPAETVGRGG